jgi:hypothetical protein
MSARCGRRRSRRSIPNANSAPRDAQEVADTVANRLRVADALADLGRYGEALPLYREMIGGVHDDARTREKLARALFETGANAEALELLDSGDPPRGQASLDRRGLLRARILEALGQDREALSVYSDIVTRLPGEEARCRYAALLIAKGRQAHAKVLLEEVESRMKRLDRQQRAAEADMYRWAADELAKLRAA